MCVQGFAREHRLVPGIYRNIGILSSFHFSSSSSPHFFVWFSSLSLGGLLGPKIGFWLDLMTGFGSTFFSLSPWISFLPFLPRKMLLKMGSCPFSWFCLWNRKCEIRQWKHQYFACKKRVGEGRNANIPLNSKASEWRKKHSGDIYWGQQKVGILEEGDEFFKISIHVAKREDIYGTKYKCSLQSLRCRIIKLSSGIPIFKSRPY